MSSNYYERRLPHWQPKGVDLFITWRLHGSLPPDRPILVGPSGTPNAFLGRTGRPFWLDESYDHWIRSEK